MIIDLRGRDDLSPDVLANYRIAIRYMPDDEFDKTPWIICFYKTSAFDDYCASRIENGIMYFNSFIDFIQESIVELRYNSYINAIWALCNNVLEIKDGDCCKPEN